MERFKYLGWHHRCPLCGWRLRRFAPDRWDGERWTGPPTRCPSCGSLPRLRLLWLLLEARLRLGGGGALLHLAPEPALAERLAHRVQGYTSADIEPGRAQIQADLAALPFADGSFDVVVCSHVLEHVPDDRAALAELHRVTRSGGLAFIQAPVNYDQPRTYEDPSVADPHERATHFSQPDHVRVYGADLRERLESTGFEVNVIDAASLGRTAFRLYGLHPGRNGLRNDLYWCDR